jgi:hypothetical protein
MSNDDLYDDQEDSSDDKTQKQEASDAQQQQPMVHASGTVVPIHAATGKINRGPGRPKKIRTEPTRDDLIYHAEMIRQKTAFIEADSLVRSASERQEAVETLQKVKEEIARESAALHFQRIEEEKYGKDTSQMSSRRIAALREVAHLELEIRRLGASSIDLKSERFQKIFAFFLETVRLSAGEVLSPEMVDLLFNRLETKLEGWEEKAQNL